MAQKVQRGFLLAVTFVVTISLAILLPAPGWAQGKGNSGTNNGKGGGGGGGGKGGGKPPKNSTCPAFEDTFDGTSVNGQFWVVANGRAPGYIAGSHIGYYQPDRVSVSGGLLRIMLTQEAGILDTGTTGVISRGGLVYSKQKCGYGTYEWRVRMSSTQSNASDPSGFPVSGSVSAGFNYVNNSETEIDFEFSAKDPTYLWMVNWNNTNPSQDPTGQHQTASYIEPFDSISGFHHYKYVWEPGKITFYVDNLPPVVHTTDVPSAPAYFMINHWGTNGPYWGGYADPNFPTRYYFVDLVRFTPLQ